MGWRKSRFLSRTCCAGKNFRATSQLWNQGAQAGLRAFELSQPVERPRTAAFRHYNVAQLESLYDTSRASNAQPLANAMVLVSYYGAGLGDMGTTSIAANQPRVVLHSTALNDLIQKTCCGGSRAGSTRWRFWDLSC